MAPDASAAAAIAKARPNAIEPFDSEWVIQQKPLLLAGFGKHPLMGFLLDR